MFLRYEIEKEAYVLEMHKDWIDLHPLTAFTLKQEMREWRKVGIKFSLSCYFLESQSVNSELEYRKKYLWCSETNRSQISIKNANLIIIEAQC